jgi:hypothetical protein
MLFCKKLDYNAKSEPPYLVTTLTSFWFTIAHDCHLLCLLMAPFFWSILEVDEGATTIGAFSWYFKLGSKKFVLFTLVLN